MIGTKRLVIILIATMLETYLPVSQKGYICDTAVVKMSVGGTEIHGTSETDKQAEYKLTIKREGKKLTLQKNAAEEIVRLMEEELGGAFPCNCMIPLDQLEFYEKNGVVIEIEYLKEKELAVRTDYPYPFASEPRLVSRMMIMTTDDQGHYITYNNEVGSRTFTKGFYEKILSYLTSENIISEEPLDFTAPKTNIKNEKTYKSGKKITFSDEGSGMKSAKLDGKKIKNGHVVKKKGKHKLVLTDKAGNKRKVKFKIK